MPDDWATQFTRDALAKVDALIAEHPGYTRQGVEQPGQGATNRVVFVRRGDDNVASPLKPRRACWKSNDDSPDSAVEDGTDRGANNGMHSD